MAYIYIAQVPSGPVKIGITDIAPQLRVTQLRFLGQRATLRAWTQVDGVTHGQSPARKYETELHRRFARIRLNELRSTQHTEWYSPCAEIQALAKSWDGSIELPVDGWFLGEGI